MDKLRTEMGTMHGITLVVDAHLGQGTQYGLSTLREVLRDRDVPCFTVKDVSRASGDSLVLIGTRDFLLMQRLLHDLPEGKEALRIARVNCDDRPALAICGSDDRGLMYALLDVAERISRDTGADVLSAVQEADERPFTSERTLSIYTMHRMCFEQRFFDAAYWDRYLGMLARNRFNTFALLFAYESAGYFAPPYPYFFDVPGYADVAVVGMSLDTQAKHLEALNRLIKQTHAHGLDFTLGIWDHIYRGGVQQGPGQNPENPLPWRVTGVTTGNLLEFSVAAITELLKRVPNIDALQFRMHGESGLMVDEMDEFWGSVYDAMAKHGKGIRFDARAKEFPDRLIDLAVKKGVPIRICTKYWMEQMGLPFHPSLTHPQNQMDRRHSYADLLRYPQKYKMHWRLWNGGTSRVLLWGDPEYVRRFSESTHIYNGGGFDVNEPLATKMASHDHFSEPFALLKPEHQHYEYEFERYWHFFQVWGRVGYNPNTPVDVWLNDFSRRFGDAGEPLMRGLHAASRILPRIVAYNYPYNLFPTTRGWVEKQRMEDLPIYADALPSDRLQFLSFREAAENMISGEDSGRLHPLKSAAWFDRQAELVMVSVVKAENTIGDAINREFKVTVTDLRILAQLARYHAGRARAGLAYALFVGTCDVNFLDDALQHEDSAIMEWEQLVEAAGNVYADDLMMGKPETGLSGHWRDELAALKTGLEALKKERADFHVEDNAVLTVVEKQMAHDTNPPEVIHMPIKMIVPNRPLAVRAIVRDVSGVKWVRLHYRHVRQDENYQVIDMQLTGGDVYEATVPGEFLVPTWDFMYLIEAVGVRGNGCLFPDLESDMPYVVARFIRS